MFSDPFHFFRWVLTIFVTVYATIVSVQIAWSYYVWLTMPDRYMTLLRQYVILHSLRLRARRFAGDALVCVTLTVALVLMIVAQTKLDRIQATLADATHVNSR
jgi:hypothetical protein